MIIHNVKIMFKKKIAAAMAFLIVANAMALGANQKMSIEPVHILYTEYSSEIASANVIRVLLEDAGYTVSMTSLSPVLIYQAIAEKQADATLAAWLPTTHKKYYERFKDKLVNLGLNLKGTKLGLVVPAYTYDAGVHSIADLEKHADKFQRKIIGIEPGSGLMQRTREVISRYHFKKMQVLPSSETIMTASLADAIKNHEDIVVTGWTPHWMFKRFDLKYLKDPENVYGDAEEIDTIVRKGLKQDRPKVYAILDHFQWTPENMNELILMNQEKGSDPYHNAKQWVASHPELVRQWMY